MSQLLELKNWTNRVRKAEAEVRHEFSSSNTLIEIETWLMG
jgi:hypothetical protein